MSEGEGSGEATADVAEGEELSESYVTPEGEVVLGENYFVGDYDLGTHRELVEVEDTAGFADQDFTDGDDIDIEGREGTREIYGNKVAETFAADKAKQHNLRPNYGRKVVGASPNPDDDNIDKTYSPETSIEAADSTRKSGYKLLKGDNASLKTKRFEPDKSFIDDRIVHTWYNPDKNNVGTGLEELIGMPEGMQSTKEWTRREIEETFDADGRPIAELDPHEWGWLFNPEDIEEMSYGDIAKNVLSGELPSGIKLLAARLAGKRYVARNNRNVLETFKYFKEKEITPPPIFYVTGGTGTRKSDTAQVVRAITAKGGLAYGERGDYGRQISDSDGKIGDARRHAENLRRLKQETGATEIIWLPWSKTVYDAAYLNSRSEFRDIMKYVDVIGTGYTGPVQRKGLLGIKGSTEHPIDALFGSSIKETEVGGELEDVLTNPDRRRQFTITNSEKDTILPPGLSTQKNRYRIIPGENHISMFNDLGPIEWAYVNPSLRKLGRVPSRELARDVGTPKPYDTSNISFLEKAA